MDLDAADRFIPDQGRPWESEGRRLDDLIVRTAPNVRDAVRWDPPWDGIEGEASGATCLRPLESRCELLKLLN